MARPRKHKEGTTATERVALSTAALKESGGARKTFRLSKSSFEAMQFLMKLPNAPKTQTELIEQLLIAAKNEYLQSNKK